MTFTEYKENQGCAEKRDWAFTFGVGHGLRNYYVVMRNMTFTEAKERMVDLFGKKWSWQYRLEDWEREPYGTKPLNDFIEIGGLDGDI